MTVLIVIVAIVAAFVGLVLLLPCKACQRRRERLQAGYEQWRQNQAKSNH